MGLTVRAALQLPELTGVQVVAGENGLDRVIQSVNVMEVPDISAFVVPGDLLLTTTYPIHNDPQALHRLIPALAERNLAGLAIKPARYITEIPEVMVEQANRHALPLLNLPPETSFARILNPILSEILDQQAELMRHSTAVHRSLTDLVLKGEGAGAVVDTLAKLLELPVAVTDRDFSLLGISKHVRNASDFTGLLRKVREEGLYPSGTEPVRRGLWVNGLLCTVLMHPIRVGTEVDGYICVFERDGELKDRDAACVEQASLVLALVLQKQRAIQETERRFHADFFRNLLTGRVPTRAEAIARGSIYGWDLTVPRVLLLLHPASPQVRTVSTQATLRMQQRLEAAVYYAVEGSRTRCLMEHMGEETILLLAPTHSDPKRAKEEAVQLAQRIVREMSLGRDEQNRLSVGVASVQTDVMQWPEGYRQAQEALHFSQEFAQSESVTHYDDLGLYRLIARVSDVAELERFCAERLGGLLEYDANHGSELLATLRAVIEADGNLHKAAEILCVHYNTLRYRIQRIQEIQGCRVDSWRQMAEVDAALKAYQVLKVWKASGRNSAPVPLAGG